MGVTSGSILIRLSFRDKTSSPTTQQQQTSPTQHTSSNPPPPSSSSSKDIATEEKTQEIPEKTQVEQSNEQQPSSPPTLISEGKMEEKTETMDLQEEATQPMQTEDTNTQLVNSRNIKVFAPLNGTIDRGTKFIHNYVLLKHCRGITGFVL